MATAISRFYGVTVEYLSDMSYPDDHHSVASDRSIDVHNTYNPHVTQNTSILATAKLEKKADLNSLEKKTENCKKITSSANCSTLIKIHILEYLLF